MVTGSYEKTVKLYLVDGNSFKLIKTFKDHTDQVNKVLFSSNGYIIASCSEDSTIKTYDLDHTCRNPSLFSYKERMNNIIQEKFDPQIVSNMIGELSFILKVNLSEILKGNLTYYQKLNSLLHFHPHICAIRSKDTAVLVKALKMLGYKPFYYLKGNSDIDPFNFLVADNNPEMIKTWLRFINEEKKYQPILNNKLIKLIIKHKNEDLIEYLVNELFDTSTPYKS